MASEALFLQKQLPLMAEERRQALVNTLGSRWELPFEVGAFYWTASAPDIVSPGRAEQGSF